MDKVVKRIEVKSEDLEHELLEFNAEFRKRKREDAQTIEHWQNVAARLKATNEASVAATMSMSVKNDQCWKAAFDLMEKAGIDTVALKRKTTQLSLEQFNVYKDMDRIHKGRQGKRSRLFEDQNDRVEGELETPTRNKGKSRRIATEGDITADDQ